MNKQREALQMALDALSSDSPDIMLRASVAIREALAEPDQELEFWPGEILICKEDDSKVTVVNGNRGSLQLMNGKIAIAWDDSVFGEYTVEQVKEMFYHAEKPEQDAPPARKPLTDEEIRELWDGHVVPVFDKNGINPIVFARAIERAHGIGGGQ